MGKNFDPDVKHNKKNTLAGNKNNEKGLIAGKATGDSS